MSQFTSTMIDDEDLIEELRKYGEKNLPTLASGTSSSSSSRKAKSNELNDSNREIYLKKLNHYRAKEKAKVNPSKQFIKQRKSQQLLNGGDTSSLNGSASKGAAKSHYDHVKCDPDEEDDEDVIEVNMNETGEYVKVANAGTSPLSFSTYENQTFEDYDNPSSGLVASRYRPSILSSTHVNYTNTNSQPQNKKIEYVSLKERIEIDKTLSKYRSEINNILTGTIQKNRSFENTTTTNQNDDIIYTGTTRKQSSPDQTQTEVLYCPKPKSLLDTLKSKFTAKSTDCAPQASRATESPFILLNQIRGGGNIANKDQPTYLIPKKEAHNDRLPKLFAFTSNLGLQLSRLLPYLVLVIFTIILLQYMRMRSFSPTPALPQTQSSTDPTPAPIPIVEPHYFCPDVKDTQCSQTKLLVRNLIDYLRSVSGNVECSVSSNPSSEQTWHGTDSELIEKCVHLNSVIDYLTVKRGLIRNPEVQTEAVDSMLEAVVRNPHWEVRLLNSSYSDTVDLGQVTYLMSTASHKPLLCRLREFVHFLYVRVIALCALVVTLLLGYLTYKSIRHYQADKQRDFFNLVGQVTRLVEKQHELSVHDPNVKPYIAISHVYDTLFEPSQRATSKKLWSRVLKFIEDHESRIHVEMQFIDGEETHVWKWIAPKSVQVKHVDSIGLANSTVLNDHQLGENNKENDLKEGAESQVVLNGWQGDAFNRSDKLMHSPTPCLKVRNMFDLASIESDPFFQVKIHNDILEKCCSLQHQSNGKLSIVNTFILHIVCDKKSKEGCVYIKCSSNEAAGKVYQSLNGTWYSGKLLNVKFLRSDRYVERFPDSAHATKPVKLI